MRRRRDLMSRSARKQTWGYVASRWMETLLADEQARLEAPLERDALAYD